MKKAGILLFVTALVLLLCASAMGDEAEKVLSEDCFERYAGSVPVYALVPETTYVIGDLSKAEVVVSRKISEMKAIAESNVAEYSHSVECSVLEVWPDADVTVRYLRAGIRIAIEVGSQTIFSGPAGSEGTFLKGAVFTTGTGSYAVEDVRITNIQVEYQLAEFTIDGVSYAGGPDEEGGYFPYAMYRFITSGGGSLIAQLSVYPPDRYAGIQVNWDYPSEERDLNELAERYQYLTDRLNATQAYNYTAGYGENSLAGEWGFNPIKTHTSGRREQDILYFFYAGRGDSHGMIFTNGGQEEYVLFSAFAAQIAQLNCNCVLVLDVVTDGELSKSDLSAFEAECAAIAGSSGRVCVLGCINNMLRNGQKHLHWPGESAPRYVGEDAPGDSSFFLAGLTAALEGYSGNGERTLSIAQIKALAEEKLRGYQLEGTAVPGEEDGSYVYRLTLQGSGRLPQRAVFAPAGVTAPIVTDLPDSIILEPCGSWSEEASGRTVFLVDISEGPVALDDLFTVSFCPEGNVCQCWSGEILKETEETVLNGWIDAFEGKIPFVRQQGEARLETEDGHPVLKCTGTGLVLLRVYSTASPDLEEKVCVYFYGPVLTPYAGRKTPVQKLYSACGGFVGAEVMDHEPVTGWVYDSYYLMTAGDTSLEGEATIILPDCFSFEFDHYVQEKTVTIESGSCEPLAIYPVCPVDSGGSPGNTAANCTEVAITYTGCIEATITIPTEACPYEVTAMRDQAADFVKTAQNEYAYSLASVGAALSSDVYDRSAAQSTLLGLGFMFTNYFDTGSSLEGIACAIGYRNFAFTDSKEIVHQVGVAVRGTSNAWEFFGDLLIYDEFCANTMHANFASATSTVGSWIDSYLSSRKIEKSTAQLFMCGHSRGAAVADLYVHETSQRWRKATAYTFAAPNSTKDPAEDSNIFNIIHVNDVVPYVPAGPEWGKYGQNILFGTPNSDNEILIGTALLFGDCPNEIISMLLHPNSTKMPGIAAAGSESLFPLIKFKFITNHQITMYVENCPHSEGAGMTMQQAKDHFETKIRNAVQALVNSTLTATVVPIHDISRENALREAIALCNLLSKWMYGTALKNIAVGCPVSVTVTDSRGNVIASFENHELVSLETSLGFGFSAEGQDYLCIPADTNCHVSILALDNGTLNARLLSVSADLSVSEESLLCDAAIVKGTKYTLSRVSGSGPNSLALIPVDSGVVIILPPGLLQIEEEAFFGTACEIIVIPDGVESIPAGAFMNCPNLKEIIIPENCSVEEGACDASVVITRR